MKIVFFDNKCYFCIGYYLWETIVPNTIKPNYVSLEDANRLFKTFDMKYVVKGFNDESINVKKTFAKYSPQTANMFLKNIIEAFHHHLAKNLNYG